MGLCLKFEMNFHFHVMQDKMYMPLTDKSCIAIVLIQPGFKSISEALFISMQDLGISRENSDPWGCFLSFLTLALEFHFVASMQFLFYHAATLIILSQQNLRHFFENAERKCRFLHYESESISDSVMSNMLMM